MMTVLLLAAAPAAILLSFLCSGMETGVYSLSRLHLSVAADRDLPGARRLSRLMRRPEDLLITILLGTNAADYLATAAVAALLLRTAVPHQLVELYATLLVTPVILVFGGVLPKNWFRQEADRLMYVLAFPLSVAVRLARGVGLIWLLRAVARAVLRLIQAQGPPEAALLPRARTMRLLQEGAIRGGLSDIQRDLIDRVMRISRTRVSSVMIPLERTARVPADIGRDDFLRVARMAHFSRLPVYGDHDSRRIVGIVSVFDVLTDRDQRPIRAHLREPYRLTPTTTVSGALVRMQRARQAMAIVQTRAGDCLGILTIKDLVEEIIGDLEVW